jgi:flagellar hook-length control protein FliK
MDSLQPSTTENSARQAEYSDPTTRQSKPEKKDKDSASSDNDVLSVFASILQNRIDIQEKGAKKSEDEQAQKTDRSKVAVDGSIKDEKKLPVGTNDAQSIASDNNAKNQIKDNTSENEPKTLQNTTVAVTSDVEELMETDANGSKESAFIKNLTVWLKQNGIQDGKIEQILSQVKNAALLKKEGLSGDTSTKDMADLLENYNNLDKDLLENSGIQESSIVSPGDIAVAQESATDMAGQGDLLFASLQQKLFFAGQETTTGMLLQDMKLEDTENVEDNNNSSTMKNSMAAIADQRQNFTVGDASALSKTEISPNLRPQYLIDQIVNSRELLEKGEGQVKLTLNPPSLGTLDMDVRVRSNRIEVMVMADNKDVKQILQTHLSDLKSALQEHGLQIDRFNIQWQDGSQGSTFREYAGRNPFWENNSDAGSKNRDIMADEYPLQNRIRAEEGMGRISVFI